MAFLNGRNTSFWFGAYDLSSFLNTSDIDRTLAALKTTTYGAAGASETYIPGLLDGKVTAGGLFDGSATGIDAELQPMLAAGTIAPLTYTLAGPGAIGNVAKLCNCEPTDYKVTSPVAGVVSLTATFQQSGPIGQGVILQPLGALTNAGNGASSVDNTASSANGGVANLHVTSVTSGTATYKVQHSTDNTTFVDLITFTAVSAVGSQQASASGTVNRYTRGAWTGTFSQSAGLAFARF